MNLDFSRISDASLTIATSSPGASDASSARTILTNFARTFNVLLLTSNISAVNNVIDRNIIDPVICKLLQEKCPSVSLVGCTSSDFKHAVLPEGWKWQTQDSYLQLIDGDGAVQFSWYYGLSRYSS